jgi:molybdopterin/thiamine biosynthesis adenylyltransferase
MEWALRNPTRFLNERAAFERLAQEVGWLTALAWRLDAGLAVEVDFDLEIHGNSYAATLTYPDLFPETPAYIWPRDASQQWSYHQYGAGGSLCLEWRADNWDSRVTGADLVRSAHTLLAIERHPDQPARVPSAHRVTLGQTMRSSQHRFVCTAGGLAAFASLPVSVQRQLRTKTLLHRSATVGFVSQIEMADGSMQDVGDLPSGIVAHLPLFAWPGDGQILRSDAFDLQVTIASVEDLLNMIQRAGFLQQTVLVQEPGSTKYQDRLVLLLGTEPRSIRAFGIEAGAQPALHEYRVILPEAPSQRLPIEHARLAEIRIGIVGLGSIGSKVAVSLARSGARKFLLVDDDLLVPGNLCRHELSWASAGVHKAEAVHEALSLVAPAIDVRVRAHRVAGQESALEAAAALKDLASCDVLIDATANPSVFLRLASIAKTHRRPLCWGELFAGGIGGMIIRARPDVDPNPAAVRAAVLHHLEQLPPAPYQQAGEYDIEDQQPLIAYDGDVGQIASALTRFVLDTALQRNPSDFPYSAYLIGLRKAWIFSQPFDTHPIEVCGAGWESESDPSVVDNDRKEAIQVLLEIAVKGHRADTDSPA